MKKKIVLLLVVSLMLLSMTVSASCGNWYTLFDSSPNCETAQECGKDENGWRSGFVRYTALERECTNDSGEVTYEHTVRKRVYECGC